MPGTKPFTMLARHGMPYVDKSGRTRIRMPELPLEVQMAPVLQSEAMSHNESEPDYEAIPRDEARVLGDSHDDIWSLEHAST